VSRRLPNTDSSSSHTRSIEHISPECVNQITTSRLKRQARCGNWGVGFMSQRVPRPRQEVVRWMSLWSDGAA
jgi:hypothetical protein